MRLRLPKVTLKANTSLKKGDKIVVKASGNVAWTLLEDVSQLGKYRQGLGFNHAFQREGVFFLDHYTNDSHDVVRQVL